MNATPFSPPRVPLHVRSRSATVALACGLLLALWGCGPGGHDPTSPDALTGTVQMAIQWNGVDVSRLRLSLVRAGVAGTTAWDVNEPFLTDDCHDLELVLAPGTWTLSVTAYDSAGGVVAAGEATFEVIAGEEINVALTLLATGEGSGRVHVTICLCPESVVESVAWSQEATLPVRLRVVATLVEGADPDRVVAKIRWGTSEAEIVLSLQAGQTRIYEGTFDVVAPNETHDVEVLAEGLPGCAPPPDPSGACVPGLMTEDVADWDGIAIWEDFESYAPDTLLWNGSVTWKGIDYHGGFRGPTNTWCIPGMDSTPTCGGTNFYLALDGSTNELAPVGGAEGIAFRWGTQGSQAGIEFFLDNGVSETIAVSTPAPPPWTGGASGFVGYCAPAGRRITAVRVTSPDGGIDDLRCVGCTP